MRRFQNKIGHDWLPDTWGSLCPGGRRLGSTQFDKGTTSGEMDKSYLPKYLQPIDGSGLFKNCLNDGLPIAGPVPIISKLSRPN
jgi:hypothetical protein